MTDLYRDSLLQTNASDSLGHVLVMADKCTVHAQYDQAITMLTDFYRKPSLDDHSKAMITYTLSEAYRLKGDKKGQKHFLALSAIADLNRQSRNTSPCGNSPLLYMKTETLTVHTTI